MRMTMREITHLKIIHTLLNLRDMFQIHRIHQLSVSGCLKVTKINYTKCDGKFLTIFNQSVRMLS